MTARVLEQALWSVERLAQTLNDGGLHDHHPVADVLLVGFSELKVGDSIA